MAQIHVVELIDDVDGTEATETMTFSLDGVSYEIDLNEGNADDLRSLLMKFTDAGRRTGGRKRAVTKVSDTRPSTKDVRAWALASGVDVSPRGRVQASVIDAYRRAN